MLSTLVSWFCNNNNNNKMSCSKFSFLEFFKVVVKILYSNSKLHLILNCMQKLRLCSNLSKELYQYLLLQIRVRQPQRFKPALLLQSRNTICCRWQEANKIHYMPQKPIISFKAKSFLVVKVTIFCPHQTFSFSVSSLAHAKYNKAPADLISPDFNSTSEVQGSSLYLMSEKM